MITKAILDIQPGEEITMTAPLVVQSGWRRKTFEVEFKILVFERDGRTDLIVNVADPA